jgi:hypothetical protein
MANMKNKQNSNPEKAGTPEHAKPAATDNNGQKTVGGKNEDGPADKVGKTAGGNKDTRAHRSLGGSSGNAPENTRNEQAADDNQKQR